MPVTKKITDLALANVAAGDDVPIAQGGFLKRAKAGQANGFATLDSSGKLIQPRRVLGANIAQGLTADPTTTSTVGTYVLPDPRLSVTVDQSAWIYLFAQIPLYANAANGYAFAQLMRSSDNGSSWNAISQYGLMQSPSAGIRGTVGLAHLMAISAGTYIFGISIGNPGGSSNTIGTHNVYRSLGYILFDF